VSPHHPDPGLTAASGGDYPPATPMVPSTPPSILSLAAITALDPVGGKARGLAKLLASGFPVPDGFVALPEAQAAEIVAAYRRLGAERVAVRSSADVEDAALLSYAGQFATFLDVGDEATLLDGVAACRGSAEGDRSRNYRVGARIAVTPRMCVIVQRMLEPAYAGVVFAEPGGPTVVEGIAGLGDRLVSGRSAPSPLPDDVRRRIERMAREAAERLGGAQDIEWAFERGRVWLLQARPVTAPLPAPLPRRVRLWTAANFQEAIPRPLTPLSEELTRENINRIFSHFFAANGLPEPDGPVERLVRGRFYMSLSAVASSVSAMPGYGVENMLRMFGERPELAPHVLYRRASRLGFLARLPAVLARFASWACLARRRTQKAREIARALDADVRRAIATDAGEAALLALCRSMTARIEPAVETVAVSASQASTFLDLLMGTARRLAPDVPSSQVAAMAATGTMESLEPSRRLASIATWIRENPDRDDRAPELQWLLADFMEACGFRSENEAELANPRWHERPEEVLRLARQLAALPVDFAAAQRVSAVPATGGRPLDTRRAAFRILSLLAQPAGAWQRRREEARAVLVRYSGSLRCLLLAIGSRLAAHETLDRAADIFYLRRREIEDLLAGPTVTADRTLMRSLVSSRQEEHRRLLSLPAPPRLLAELPDGRCVPFEPEAQSGEILRGFGASPGRIGGRARVLHDIGRAGDLEPGEILVTRTTDIGWTPLFQIAAAVVTEIGALASHAAIVARELGLPAVVNLDRATERIRSGDRLFVDGWAGTVRILHEPGAKE